MNEVDGKEFGGVKYEKKRKIMNGIVKKGRVVGMDIVEIKN